MERQEERDRPALCLGALHGHTRASQRMANGLKPCLAPGEGTHVLDEAERSLHDALCVLAATVKDARVVLGGGFPEMAMARVVRARCIQMFPSMSSTTASCCGTAIGDMMRAPGSGEEVWNVPESGVLCAAGLTRMTARG